MPYTCISTLEFVMSDHKKHVKIIPMSILDLGSKVGGFVTIVMSVRILLYLRNLQRTGIHIDVDSLVRKEEFPKILEEERIRLVRKNEEAFPKDVFIIPM